MKIVILIGQVLLGLMFVVFGLNGFLHFIHQPMPPAGSPPAQFFAVMAPSGWFSVIFLFQLLGGLLVLLGRTAPLGLCLLGPVVVNILCYHAFLMHGQGIGAGLLAALLWALVFYGYRTYFAGIFSTSARPAV